MFSIIIWLVLGFVAGYLAKLIMPGPDGGGVILTTILGIVGAVIGGLVATYIFRIPMADSTANLSSSLLSFVFSVVGAIVILAIYRLATGRSMRG